MEYRRRARAARCGRTWFLSFCRRSTEVKRFSMGLIVALLGITAWADLVPPGTDDEIRERLQPVGEVCREGDGCGGTAAVATGGGSGLSGEQIYGQFCFACHDLGVADAPKIGDTAAWDERAAKGMDTLLESSMDGLNMMPAMGTCMSCTEDEMRSTIEYILGRSG